MQYRYNWLFLPPGPVIPIRVSASAASASVRVLALLDTGSDATAIPDAVAQALNLVSSGTGEIEGVVEGPRKTDVFSVFLSIDRGEPLSAIVVTWHEDYALLGRDILNKYHLTLDGPNLTFTLSR